MRGMGMEQGWDVLGTGIDENGMCWRWDGDRDGDRVRPGSAEDGLCWEGDEDGTGMARGLGPALQMRVPRCQRLL